MRWTPRKRQATDKPPVVTNTTPLITLAGIELLGLLPQLYGVVWAPRIVLDEYQVKAPPTEPNLAEAPWLRVVDNVVIDPALPLLDVGEAAALSLAQTIGARLILLDERKARLIAARMGLPVAGTLAVLLRAKQHGFITAVHPYIIQMQSQGRRFHPDLITRLLEDAGE
jgi:predicted nucleic acid-binding protein